MKPIERQKEPLSRTDLKAFQAMFNVRPDQLVDDSMLERMPPKTRNQALAEATRKLDEHFAWQVAGMVKPNRIDLSIGRRPIHGLINLT